MWGFLKVRVWGIGKVMWGGLRRRNPRGFWVRLVAGEIFRSKRVGLGRVTHPQEVGSARW